MVNREDLHDYLNALLNVSVFQDYAPNGLQVQGRAKIKKLVTGVTASLALLEAAVAQGADAVLVHHGYFWRNEAPEIVGLKHQRIKTLLDHELNLFGYHLPLDAHPELGNNARLGALLGLEVTQGFEEDITRSIGLVGQLQTPLSGGAFAKTIQTALNRQPLHIPAERPIRTVAWCTGGAQGYIDKALRFGVDAYITGEVSEQTVHIARESGIHFFAAGHHATERYGVQAVGRRVAQTFHIEHQFIDIDNPA